MHRTNRAIVNTPACLLPDQINLIHHLEAVAEQRDLAAFVVVPPHRNLFQIQTRAKGEIKQLHIKPKAIARRCFDQRAAHTHPKSLEATLRVAKRHSGGKTNDQIEDASTLLATP